MRTQTRCHGEDVLAGAVAFKGRHNPSQLQLYPLLAFRMPVSAFHRLDPLGVKGHENLLMKSIKCQLFREITIQKVESKSGNVNRQHHIQHRV